ncbi:MFS transporter [Saccharopolyspora taberi]|uniref:MFS transporter n=1 Tax=Saccharopolyspora taberi TaxID=60895 RepID=A0ABN3V8W2_9PSEU
MKPTVPLAVHVLAMGIFAMVTSEFAVAGLMPQMAQGLAATIPQIGYLITAYAVAMALGGPVLTIALMRMPPKRALLLIFGIFLAGNALAAAAPGYAVMVVARVVTGAAAQAFFGIGLSVCAQLAAPEVRGRAIAVATSGLMLGTLLGLPLSTLVGERFGWRAAFWAITALAALAAACTTAGVPRLDRPADGGGFRGQADAFRKPRLWLALSSSMLVIGATFAAFSYFTPILTEITGFGAGTVPLLLIAYGAATVVGNNVVGRLADRHTSAVLLAGLVLNALFLVGFALLAHLSVAAVALMLGVGLVGVTMNPAMITRVQRAGNTGPLVGTVHTSFITIGVTIGSLGGGIGIELAGLRAPLWLGAALAAIGVLTVLPELRRGPEPAAEPEAHRAAVG